MMIKTLSVSAMLLVVATCTSAKPIQRDETAEGVIPSPNQEFGDETSVKATQEQQVSAAEAPVSKVMANVPVYVSPYARTERSAPNFENQQESSHAPVNYAPKPAASGPVAKHMAQKDLKAAASYGHGHGHGHGHHGYDHSGWLDMGAWTGGKGSFGWYADYPVGGKHHGHGKRR